MNKILTRASIVALIGYGVFMGTGCSVDGSITDTTIHTRKDTSSQMTGIASGSGQTMVTSNNYTVSSSVGSPYGGDLTITTANGYTVYSTLQGNLNADTFQDITE